MNLYPKPGVQTLLSLNGVCHPLLSTFCKSKNLLEETELVTGVGGWQLDVQTNRFLCTEGIYNLLGLSQNTGISWDHMLSFLGSDAYGHFKQATEQVITENEPVNIELYCGKR